MTRSRSLAQDTTQLSAEGWVHVGVVDDVPLLEGRRTTIAGRRVALFRLLNGLAAIDADCPHQGGPLQDGLVADSCVTCPLHDRRIDLTTGAMIGGGGSVTVHEVHVDGPDVWLRLGQPSEQALECLPALAG